VAQGWQSPLLGAQHVDFRGTRHALGRTADAYAVWDLAAGGEPIEAFPLTEEGWARAWARYQGLEGPTATAQAQAHVQLAWQPSPTASWRKGQPLAIGPMRPGQILDGAFRLYRMRFGTLIAVVAFVLLPFHILTLVLTIATLRPVLTPSGATLQQPALWVTLLTAAVQVLFVTPFLTAAVVKTAADTYLGRDATVGSTYRAALSRVHSILWVTFLAGLAVGALFIPGAALLIIGTVEPGARAAIAAGAILILVAVIPAIFVFLRLSFGSAVVMVEGIRGTEALRRSWRLVKGLTWKVLGTTLLAALLVFVLVLVIGVIFGVVAVVALRDALITGGGPGTGFYAAEQAFNAVGALLTAPFLTLVSVLLYFDARVRKEAFDLSLMAQQLGTSPPVGA
jgi:hypothetical protein